MEQYLPDDADTATKKAELKIIDDCVRTLRQHFQTVQILVTRETTLEDISLGRDADNTLSVHRGSGNWYARYGQAVLFVEQANQIERNGCHDS